MVECLGDDGVWRKAVIDSVHPETDCVAVAANDDGSRATVQLEHPPRCRVRSLKGGPVSLCHIVYSCAALEDLRSWTLVEKDTDLRVAGPSGVVGQHGGVAGVKARAESTNDGWELLEADMSSTRGSEGAGAPAKQHGTGSPARPKKAKTRYRVASSIDSALEGPRYRGWKPSQYEGLLGGSRGLANLGNTCYMNAVLQCLAHCGPLVEVMLGLARSAPENRKQPLTLALREWIECQWTEPSGGAGFRPLSIKQCVGSRSNQFAGSMQQDAQEFLSLLLNSMHEELNRAAPNAPYREIPDLTGKPDMVVAQAWWDNHCERNDSALQDLFLGQLRSRVTCQSCKHASTTFDPFWSLSVPIPARGSEVALEDCLKSFFRSETLVGSNAFYCPTCKAEVCASKRLSLFRCPSVLVVHLKRFKTGLMGGEASVASATPTVPLPAGVEGASAVSVAGPGGGGVVKVTTKVVFPGDDFDLRPYCSRRAHLDQWGRPLPLQYDLVGIVNHLGASASHGHYTADCFEPRGNKWMSFDDSFVQPTQMVQQDAAYILIYIRAPLATA